jgi:hypothetical protein
MKLNLKKTDYIVIAILIIVVISGIIGLVVALNLMGQNDERDRQRRNNVTADLNTTVENETNIVNAVDTNVTPDQQMQQLVNALPNVLNNQTNQPSIQSIKIRYAYGYDVALTDEKKYLDVLEIDCKDDELKILAQLLEKNKLDESETLAQTSSTTYYNTQMVIDGDKVLSFSDKNATYKHGDKTTAVTLSDELLTKAGEIVNTELAKHVNSVDPTDIKTIVVTNANNASVTITDATDIKSICALTGCVNFNKGIVDVASQKVVYNIELSNGIKMQIASGGSMGYVINGNNKQEVKFMFNVEQGLEAIFKKYAN